jgi:hypothetical protein
MSELNTSTAVAYMDQPIIKPEASPRGSSERRLRRLLSAFIYRLTGIIFFLCTVMVLVLGWKMRQQEVLTAEYGTGYALGIIGASCMLTMLLYSLRKRIRFMHAWGTQKIWFQMHMLLGVIGPVLILFHANFGLGSLNSNVALFCMLLVAGSGLVGRFIYRKIHYGLYGKQASLQTMQESLELDKGNLGVYLMLPDAARAQLEKIETCSKIENFNPIHRIWIFFTISIRASLAFSKVKKIIKKEIAVHSEKANWDTGVKKAIRAEVIIILTHYIKTLVKITQLSTYEKLFSLWHVLHIPLFIMMLITAVVHVFAVHMY